MLAIAMLHQTEILFHLLALIHGHVFHKRLWQLPQKFPKDQVQGFPLDAMQGR